MLSRSPQTVSLDTSISFLRPYHCIPSTITPLCISPCWHLLITYYPFHSTVFGGFPDTGVEMLKPLRLHLSLHYLYQVSHSVSLIYSLALFCFAQCFIKYSVQGNANWPLVFAGAVAPLFLNILRSVSS
ncbi:hypothetical protein EV421DRAFT_461733 [Armillaria borealis]|uniref:Uncharacterized protein n=1 Tax=Armillaria borealis TaxID=47425 RepID=A0AA39K5L7_9AGAR|nr:hypothetical protein EV421DRAFT_461733 [Armillaria borealis]